MRIVLALVAAALAYYVMAAAPTTPSPIAPTAASANR